MIRHRKLSERVVWPATPPVALVGAIFIALTSSLCWGGAESSGKPEWFRDTPPRTPADALADATPPAAAPDQNAAPAAPVAPAPPPAAAPAPAPQVVPASPPITGFNDGGFADNRRAFPPLASNSDYPFAEINGYVIAEARLATARALFRRAENELSAAYDNAKAGFESSAEVRDALRDENSAYENLNAARRKALQPLAGDAQYQKLATLHKDLTEQIAERRAAHDMAQERIVALAKLKIAYAIAMREMESAALAGDDGGGVKSAQDKLVAAGARVAALRAGYDQSLRTNPQIVAARRNLEDARIMKITAAAYADGTALSAEQALDYAYYLHRQQSYNISADAWGWGMAGPRY